VEGKVKEKGRKIEGEKVGKKKKRRKKIEKSNGFFVFHFLKNCRRKHARNP